MPVVRFDRAGVGRGAGVRHGDRALVVLPHYLAFRPSAVDSSLGGAPRPPQLEARARYATCRTEALVARLRRPLPGLKLLVALSPCWAWLGTVIRHDYRI